ncbi:MAG: hypothetical protein M1817_002715 [Caeruleum heppii]|nr:MAG: hypothetical protein M1817_002715 [Caeruleum heppii]
MDAQRAMTTPSAVPRRSASTTTSFSRLKQATPSFSLGTVTTVTGPSTTKSKPTISRSETSALPKPQAGPTASKTSASTSGSEPGRRVVLSGKSSILEPATVGSQPAKRQRNVLRRKPSSIHQHSMSSRSSAPHDEPVPALPPSDSSSRHGGYVDPFPGSILGITLPSTTPAGPSKAMYRGVTPTPRVSPYGIESGGVSQHASIPHLPPPTTPHNGPASSPSSRYSESPGPFSRASTPTSMSSHSPGITVSTKFSVRSRHPSPINSRPPVTRRAGIDGHDNHLGPDATGLPSLRESLTSSSSGSTVKPAKSGTPSEQKTRLDHAKDKQKRRVPRSPPSPPLRSSSRRFARGPEAQESTKPANVPGGIVPPSAGPKMARSLKIDTTSGGKSSSHGQAPPRPKRESGAILDYRSEDDRPVIQSNLSGLPTAARKRREMESEQRRKGPQSATSTSSLDLRWGSGSRISSRDPSRSPTRGPDQPVLEQNNLSRGNTLKKRPRADSKASKTSASSAITSQTKATPRFGFFSRRNRDADETALAEQGPKSIRRGPAAGTGHEGYGKYATRGRSGSLATTAGSRGRSASAASSAGSAGQNSSSRKSSVTSRNEPVQDDFLADRLTPVVITGGGGATEEVTTGPELSQVESNQSSTAAGRPSISSNHSSSTQFSSFSSEPKRSTELPRASPSRLLRSPLSMFRKPSSRRPSMESESDEPVKAQTLATRRSLRRSQLFDNLTSLNIPPPAESRSVSRSPSPLGSRDASIYSGTPHVELPTALTEDVSEGKEGNWLKPKKTPNREKSPFRWNPFQKASDSVPNERTATPEVQAAVGRRGPHRPVAHYAMLDSSEGLETDNLEDLMIDVDAESPVDVKAGATQQGGRTAPEGQGGKPHVPSMLLPDPPVLPVDFVNNRPASPKVMLRSALSPPGTTTPEHIAAEPPRRPCRLPQIGRIPPVISTRDRAPTTGSFAGPVPANRPPPAFLPSSANSTPAISSLQDPGFNWTTSRKSSIDDVDAVSRPGPVGEAIDGSSPRMMQPAVGNGSFTPTADFLTIPRRQDSQLSGSSSSGFTSLTTKVSLVADPNNRGDEIWNEYDDLIDDVLSETSSMPPAKLSASPRFIDLVRSPSISPDEADSHNVAKADVAGDLATAPSLADSRLSAVRNSGSQPPTPLSFTTLYADYGERNVSESKHGSGSSHSRTTSFSSHTSRSSGRGATAEAEHEENHNGLDSETNLRFGALMTSRWLSFGRVLFSPAHDEMSQPPVNHRHDRLLILDGLCNGRVLLCSKTSGALLINAPADDWSFYCSLTYPNATVYNLSPSQMSSTLSAKKRDSGAWSSPSNHRQIFHPNIENPFPFPKGFFSVVVVRFPTAGSEGALRNAISECKRVLRPGGHLEISVLDLDLMNMGNRARRAVRMLKVRMHIANEGVSLKPASDNIQRLLGRRGFENVNRCMLGVPVAGKVAGSRAHPLSSSGPSLSELLRNDSHEGDEGITKMVAKVGRWWYTRCYEHGTLPDGDLSRSIWNDPALLRECEKRKTSFKLLICHAQKPTAPKRRTVSV